MSSTPMTIGQIEKLHWALLILAVGVAFLIPGASPASVAVGGAFMGANVNLMKHLLGRLLRPGREPRVGVAIGLLALKLGLFLGLLLLLFRRISIDGLSFAGGATVFLVAAVVGTALSGDASQGEL